MWCVMKICVYTAYFTSLFLLLLHQKLCFYINACGGVAGCVVTSDASAADVNECHSVNDCSDMCVNTVGSFRCACNPGYELESDRYTCIGEQPRHTDHPAKQGWLSAPITPLTKAEIAGDFTVTIPSR